MSIILDALKKAERERSGQKGETPTQGNPFVVEGPPARTPWTTYGLVGLAILSLCFMIYLRFVRGRSVAVPRPIAPVAPLTEESHDVNVLKLQARQAFLENRL